MRRQIIYDLAFDKAVEALGGYKAIDRALDTLIEALDRNPYAFERFENDFVGFRYALTRQIDDLPPLVVVFRIEQNGNVVLEHLEENTRY